MHQNQSAADKLHSKVCLYSETTVLHTVIIGMTRWSNAPAALLPEQRHSHPPSDNAVAFSGQLPFTPEYLYIHHVQVWLLFNFIIHHIQPPAMRRRPTFSLFSSHYNFPDLLIIQPYQSVAGVRCSDLNFCIIPTTLEDILHVQMTMQSCYNYIKEGLNRFSLLYKGTLLYYIMGFACVALACSYWIR